MYPHPVTIFDPDRRTDFDPRSSRRVERAEGTAGNCRASIPHPRWMVANVVTGLRTFDKWIGAVGVYILWVSEMHPPIAAPLGDVNTERLSLRRFERDDLDDLAACSNTARSGSSPTEEA
jgi:hypothetical protein